jgi:hypothetical protein
MYLEMSVGIMRLVVKKSYNVDNLRENSLADKYKYYEVLRNEHQSVACRERGHGGNTVCSSAC